MDLPLHLLADYDGHMDGWGTGAWILMSIGMVAFWAAVVVAFVWIARNFGAHRRLSPAEVLERRLAEGEISVAEYRERKQELGG